MSIEIIGLVAEWKMDSASTDVRSNKFISRMITLLTPEDTRVSRIKEFKELGKGMNSQNMKRDYNNTVNLSIGMIKVLDLVVLQHLEVSTMKKLVGLSNKIEKRDDLSINLLDGIKDIVGVGVGYNNSIGIYMNKVLSDIQPEVIKVTYKEASTIVAGLGAEDKNRLLMALMEELGYEVAREVA